MEEDDIVWSVKENASLYEALRLDDRSSSEVWNANVEVTHSFITQLNLNIFL